MIRIVKLCFAEEFIPAFEKMFAEKKHLIRKQEGCTYLSLLQDSSNKNVFFTYSIWQSQADLEKYRTSQIFVETWAFIKPHFIEKPAAWSVNEHTILP